MGLVRLALSESMILAAFGSLVGLLLSYWISGLLVTFLPIENSGARYQRRPEYERALFHRRLDGFDYLAIRPDSGARGYAPGCRAHFEERVGLRISCRRSDRLSGVCLFSRR